MKNFREKLCFRTLDGMFWYKSVSSADDVISISTGNARGVLVREAHPIPCGMVQETFDGTIDMFLGQGWDTSEHVFRFQPAVSVMEREWPDGLVFGSAARVADVPDVDGAREIYVAAPGQRLCVYVGEKDVRAYAHGEPVDIHARLRTELCACIPPQSLVRGAYAQGILWVQDVPVRAGRDVLAFAPHSERKLNVYGRAHVCAMRVWDGTTVDSLLIVDSQEWPEASAYSYFGRARISAGVFFHPKQIYLPRSNALPQTLAHLELVCA